MMNRENLSTLIGFTLLAVCFIAAGVRVLAPRSIDKGDARVVVRIAHWQLETGLRDAFDALARDYERTHPGVRIEQVTIPDRVYASWLRTQLVGGTAPDLLQLGRGTDDGVLARYFTPFDEQVEQPNPYNRGTPAEAVAWRDTFIDGLTNYRSYNPNLLSYYGVPSSVFTVRMFYNRVLWRRLLGDTPPPQSYGEFIALCERVSRESERIGEDIVPITSSKEQAPLLLGRLFGSQTQRLSLELSGLGTLRPSSAEIGLGYLNGRWGLETEGVAEGLSLMRDVGRHLQPGFMQLARDDATFHFIQGRALMVTTGSWDAPSFRAQADFEIGVFAIPLPVRGQGDFGRGVLGAAAEGYGNVGLVFGLSAQSRHKAEAVSFLQFLTSREGNRKFAEVSGWLPAVDGVRLPAALEPFRPLTEGYPDGFDLTLFNLGSETKRVVETQLNDLMNPHVDMGSVRRTIESVYEQAIKADISRSMAMTAQNIRRQDALLIARHMTGAPEKDLGDLLESQLQMESSRAWIERELIK